MLLKLAKPRNDFYAMLIAINKFTPANVCKQRYFLQFLAVRKALLETTAIQIENTMTVHGNKGIFFRCRFAKVIIVLLLLLLLREHCKVCWIFF